MSLATTIARPAIIKIKINITVVITKTPHYWSSMRGNYQWPVDSSHKGPIMRETFPYNDTIMYSPAPGLVHPNFTISFPKVGELQWETARESHLTADNGRVGMVPVVITHRAPLVVMVNFHATLVGAVTTNQSDAWNYAG